MSEQLLISGIQAKDEIYETLTELVDRNRVKVLLAMDEEKTNKEIAEEADVSKRTVKRAKKDLQDADLIDKVKQGTYEKKLSVLDEPLMKNLIERRLEEDG